MSIIKSIATAAGMVLVCGISPAAHAGVIFNSQNRFVKYDRHDTVVGDATFTNQSASDFGPFSVLTGTFPTYIGVSQVSTIGPNSFDAKGHALPQNAPSGSGQNHTAYNAQSHYEVTFTLDTATGYHLTLAGRPPGVDPTYGPTYATIKLTGPGATTTTFQSFNIYEFDPKNFTGNLAPGQYTFSADAFYSSSNFTTGFPQTFDVVYDVSFQLPEPSVMGVASLLFIGGLRFRGRVTRS